MYCTKYYSGYQFWSIICWWVFIRKATMHVTIHLIFLCDSNTMLRYSGFGIKYHAFFCHLVVRSKKFSHPKAMERKLLTTRWQKKNMTLNPKPTVKWTYPEVCHMIKTQVMECNDDRSRGWGQAFSNNFQSSMRCGNAHTIITCS